MNPKHLIYFLILLSLVNVVGATISGLTVVTNMSTEGRCQASSNCSINISYTDSLGSNATNISLPGFTTTALAAANITSNMASTAIIKSGNYVNITYTGNASGFYYFNFTVNVKTPSYSIDLNNISVSARNSTTAVNGNLYIRNSSRPYYVVANNSVFTVGTETFGDMTTTIPLTGQGSAIITIYAPNTTSTNQTVGWGATNISSLKATASMSGGNPTNEITIYLIPDPDVANPVIVLTARNEVASGNLPAAVIAGGAITAIVVLYRIRRRTR